MQKISDQLIQNFRAPAFPGSYFISFEGIEGAGKSTQIMTAKAHLESLNMRVLVLREPGGTSFGERLRKTILETTAKLHPLAEAYLFASARAQLLWEVILKELAIPNTCVICDRYLDSSLAYQGVARNLGVENILAAHNIFPLHLVPHKTFYLKISLETSLARQKLRGNPQDYFESQGREFHQKLIEGFDLAATLFAQRIEIINGEAENGVVSSHISASLGRLIRTNS